MEVLQERWDDIPITGAYNDVSILVLMEVLQESDAEGVGS